MKNLLLKSIYFLFFFSLVLTSFLSGKIKADRVSAQEPIPELQLPCEDTRPNEFHSIRPYQAAPCGDAPKARFCSNKLVIFENFQLASKCQEAITGCDNCDTICYPDYYVEPHNLNITLDDSEFPIMGNTEDQLDDATKLNEYASWYLNGVVDKKENEEATNDQIVNFSGPVRKLIPSMIQDQQRIKTIESALKVTKYTETDSGEEMTERENHNQIVIDNERLLDWNDDLSFLRGLANGVSEVVTGGLLGGVVTGVANTIGLDLSTNAWNKRTPPLPWDDGTVVDDYSDPDAKPKEKIPFKNNLLYQKAYNEWLGKSCVISDLFGLQCADIRIGPLDFVTNRYADLWHYVPLSNNSDDGGKNYILTADGPSYIPSNGTKIIDDQHVTYSNAPLYFAHTQEVKDLSDLLVKTYQPSGYESMYLSNSVEEINRGTDISPYGVESPPEDPSAEYPDGLPPNIDRPERETSAINQDPYALLDCSALNVRVNEGDNLFPGDRKSGKEIFVEGAEYLITEVKCHEENIDEWVIDGCLNKQTNVRYDCNVKKTIFTCPAQVGIEFKTGTQTPYADEIFANTVSESGSTFRKIFPKVEKGAPVECIADMPTTTNVTYSIDNPLNERPIGGEQEFKETKYPADGTGGTQLTFPHVGSVYEYFLKGIQTALRPKGYGEPIANGVCNSTDEITCGEWEEMLEQSSGGDCGVCTSGLGDLAKKILATAGKQYNVPAASIWAAMKHEGGDWDEFRGQFTDENVRKWSTPLECGGEPMPSCDPGDISGSKAYPPFGHLPYWFYRGDADDGLWGAVQQFDPSRNSVEKVSHCNFLDATFAAAKNLSTWSAYGRSPASCFGHYLGGSNKPGSCSSSQWTPAKIVQSHVGYWIGTTPWCPDGSGGPSPLVNNIPIPDYAIRVLNDYNSAKCN